MRIPCLALLLQAVCAVSAGSAWAADDALAIFDKRIKPILQAPAV